MFLVNFVLYCTDEHTSLLDYGAQIKKFRPECSKNWYQKEIRRLSMNRRIPQGGWGGGGGIAASRDPTLFSKTWIGQTMENTLAYCPHE